MSEHNISQKRKNNFAFNDVVLFFLVNTLKTTLPILEGKKGKGTALRKYRTV